VERNRKGGQNPSRVVAPIEEEEEVYELPVNTINNIFITISKLSIYTTNPHKHLTTGFHFCTGNKML